MTFTVRLLRSAPAANVAVATPEASVAVAALVSVPLSAANEIGTPPRLTLPGPLTIAVTVTVSPPLSTCTALARTSTAVAVDVVQGVALEAALAGHGAAGLPNSGAPASGPLSPHALMMAAAAIVIRIFSNLFMRRSLAFVWTVALSAPLFGR